MREASYADNRKGNVHDSIDKALALEVLEHVSLLDNRSDRFGVWSYNLAFSDVANVVQNLIRHRCALVVEVETWTQVETALRMDEIGTTYSAR